MLRHKLRRAAMVLAGVVMLAAMGVWVRQAFSEPVVQGQGKAAEQRSAESLTSEFARLQKMIKPKPGGFEEIPWMTSLWEARKKAAAEGKPLLIWTGEGHPLGHT